MEAKAELWELVGTYFRLPIIVRWNDVVAQIQPASIPMLRRQETAMNELLSEFCKESEGMFYAVRADLAAYAIPSTASDPEEIVQWTPQAPKITVPHEETEPEGEWRASEFAAEYCASKYSIIRDKLIVDAVYVSFCRFMLDQLLNKRKPVDLMFCEIIPFMFRKNWVGVMANRDCNSCGPLRKGCKRRTKVGKFSRDPEIMIKRGLHECLIDEKLLGWDEDHRVPVWSLHVAQKPSFRTMARKVEMARRRRLKSHYFAWVLTQMKAQLPSALDYYSAFLEEARLPFVDFRLCTVVGGEIALARQDDWMRNGSKAPVNRKHIPSLRSDAFVLSDLYEERQSARDTLETATESVPEMFDLRSQKENVW